MAIFEGSKGYLQSWSKYDKNVINLLYIIIYIYIYIYIIKIKSNWINNVQVNIVEWAEKKSWLLGTFESSRAQCVREIQQKNYFLVKSPYPLLKIY